MGAYEQNVLGQQRKVAVEECVQMDSAWLTRERAFDPDGCPEGVMAWRGGWDQRVLASVGYQVCLEQKLIYLEYATARNGQRRYLAQLTASDLPWSGKRWWFRCPILNGDRACGRRVAKLYLPPGQISFGCRVCHNLTYQSCRDSHRFDWWRMSDLELDIPSSEMTVIVSEHQAIHDLERKERRGQQRLHRRRAMGWK